MGELQSLVGVCDCFGWVPTIRGSLSLDLINDANEILGDVDKYSVEIKNYKKLRSEHYLAATSLLTVNDSKVGEDILRSFRYIFVGTINEAERCNRYLDKYNLTTDKSLANYLSKQGMLLGHLIILVENPERLTSDEVGLIKHFQKITEKARKYHSYFNVDAASMKQLAEDRHSIIEVWKEIESLAEKIEKSEENVYPVYCFDTVLTRDGILLLKDVTEDRYKQTYAEPGSPDDYTCNVPVHRLFKVAMNYIKYLFHSNYHHNQEHDTFLPASNLHPAKAGSQLDLTRIFRHQLEAFLAPVVKLKRHGFKDYTIDANGILLYTKAFVNVFKHNKLVADVEIRKAEDFLDIQEKEVNYMMQSKKSLVTAVLSQRNFVFILTGILAFIVAVLKIVTTFFCFEKIDIFDWAEEDGYKLTLYLIFLVALVFSGFCIYMIPSSLILKNRFRPKKIKKKWFFRNSNLEKGKLALAYSLYIDYSGMKLNVNISVWQCLKNMLYAAILLILGFLYYCMLFDADWLNI